MEDSLDHGQFNRRILQLWLAQALCQRSDAMPEPMSPACLNTRRHAGVSESLRHD